MYPHSVKPKIIKNISVQQKRKNIFIEKYFHMKVFTLENIFVFSCENRSNFVTKS